MSLDELLTSRAVLVCLGAGGVGKTTTAAALAIAAAQLGRRVCVVTVDPARRLADALGTAVAGPTGSRPTSDPTRIEGPWKGSLDAVMLEPRAVFDRLVRRYGQSEEQVERIFANRVYQNLVDALSGTQEYMATELLYELHQSSDYDLVVVDTPPARGALDFLAAPRRLASFLDNRLFRLLIAPGRISAKGAAVASQLLLRTLGKVAGSEIVEDAITFFRAFEGMEQGFRERASATERLLRDPCCSYVLVTTPRADAVHEAALLGHRLTEEHREPELVIANRLQEDFGALPPSLAAVATDGSPFGEELRALEELHRQASAEAAVIGPLIASMPGAALIRVPLLATDIHDLGALTDLARLLRVEALP